MKQVLILLLGIYLVACDRKFNTQDACGFRQNSNLQRVSWKRSTPISIYAHVSLSASMIVKLREAAAVWNTAAGKELFRIAPEIVSILNNSNEDGYNVVYLTNDWDATNHNETAVTTSFYTGNQMLEGDIRINNKYHTFYTGDSSTFVGIDFKSLMIHELGHVLGLSHSDYEGSVMQPVLHYGFSKRTISQNDLNNINCEY